VQLLENHPQFEITALAASDRSQGKTYAEACSWKLSGDIPAGVREIEVCAPHAPLDCDVVFSSLPGDIARATEEEFVKAGYPVISNSSAFRMDEDVPLLIPEVNHEHLALLEIQRKRLGDNGGFIVTNPNCSAIGVVIPLAPLQAAFGIEAVVVTTMQAISGAGYPGVPSLDITDNVFPYIGGEEEKVEAETRKLLGRFANGGVENAAFQVSLDKGSKTRTRQPINHPSNAPRPVQAATQPTITIFTKSSPKKLDSSLTPAGVGAVHNR